MNREQFLAIDDIEIKEIEVKNYGKMKIKTLSAIDQAELSRFQKSTTCETRLAAFIITLGVVDDDGTPFLTADDVEMLIKKNAGTVEKIANEIIKLSGISEDEVLEAEKN
ncbi:MAG: hypothetical protein ABS70_00535 [Nitrospira sp. SCN 59-13]|nr:MAG: hypothetical protein ABS70_00535 [Nitrospira sp. SCN 59-13]